MKLIEYLENVYGYDTPIFLKDVRIGRKSKTAIKEAFSRAYKKGEIERNSNGIYYLKSHYGDFDGCVTINQIVEEKYIYDKNFFPALKELGVQGYYSGVTFQNQIGISQQVPAVLEITTNMTTSSKRLVKIGGFRVIIRKPKTKITYQNYKMLQFLEMFSFIPEYEVVRCKKQLVEYIRKNSLSKREFTNLVNLFSHQTLKKITEGGLLNAFVDI